MSEKVKPCPYCGLTEVEISSSSGAWMASCTNKECENMGFVSTSDIHYEDILKRWNNRFYETQLEESNKTLTQLLRFANNFVTKYESEYVEYFKENYDDFIKNYKPEEL